MIEMQVTHIIEHDEVRRWLAEYDIDPKDIIGVSIDIGKHWYHEKNNVAAWLEVTWYAKNGLGVRYLSGDRESAAMNTTTIPLKSLPTLTPAAVREVVE